MNGSSTGGETTYPNEVTFDCDDGFIMAGSRIRKCQSNGIWSGDETSCRGILTFFERTNISFFHSPRASPIGLSLDLRKEKPQIVLSLM